MWGICHMEKVSLTLILVGSEKDVRAQGLLRLWEKITLLSLKMSHLSATTCDKHVVIEEGFNQSFVL